MDKKTVCFIFARGGSKGLPKKNILPISGKPLLIHSIRIAKSIKAIDSIYVSTDSQEIADLAFTENIEVIKRPSELAKDNSPEWLSWQHAIQFVYKREGHFDIFVSLPTTAPLRIKEDVNRCIKALEPDVDLVITITKAQKSPWFNIVKADELLNIQTVLKNNEISRRQDSPSCFDLTPVAYVTRPDFVLQTSSMWDGIVRGVEIPNERSIDIDTSLDFAFAKFLLENKNNNI